MILQCTADAVWTGVAPVCTATPNCGYPVAVDKAFMEIVKEAQGDPWYAAGATISYTCNDGYQIAGTVRRSAYRSCSEKPEWTGTLPVCEVIPPVVVVPDAPVITGFKVCLFALKVLPSTVCPQLL